MLRAVIVFDYGSLLRLDATGLKNMFTESVCEPEGRTQGQMYIRHVIYGHQIKPFMSMHGCVKFTAWGFLGVHTHVCISHCV